VALRQKEIIASCNRKGKVVITATQMLESMIGNPRPTRAEVSDVSNAILDGTDAVMLSGETAMGRYPVEAVRFMEEIARKTEGMLDIRSELASQPYLEEIADAVAHAACVLARRIGAAALVCSTRSGLTPRLVSRYRPACPVLAVSAGEAIARRLAIVWGVTPLASRSSGRPTGDRSIQAVRAARDAGLVRTGQTVVVASGAERGELRGRTNLVRVEIV
jgi:pyruvate kinase